MPAQPDRRFLASAIVGVAFFMHGLDSTIVSTALPHMAVAFGVNPVRLDITIVAYMLSMAVFVPVSGWIADRFGAAVIFAAAIGLFTLGSLICGISNGLVTMTAARVVQGLGAAMIIPVGRLVVLNSVDKSDYIRAMVIVSLFPTAGIMLGPPVGGFISTYVSWRWIFLINLPVGALGIVMVWRYIENYRALERRHLDWTGFVLTGITLSALLYGFEGIGRSGADTHLMAALLGGGLIAGFFAIRHARKSPNSLLDLSLLQIETLRKNATGGSLFRVSAGAVPFLMPLLFQIPFGKSAFDSGLLTLSIGAGILSVRMFAERLLKTFGFRRSLVVNSGLLAIGFVLCTLLTPSTPGFLIVPLLFACGVAQGFQYTSLNALSVADVPRTRLSAATSLTQLCQQLSHAVGVAVAASLLHVGMFLRDAEVVARSDFVIAFLALAVLDLCALWTFWTMAPNAGAEITKR